MKKDFFREFFKGLDLSEKNKENTLIAIRDIYRDKDDLQNFRGTKWGIYNAVCDFVSNREPLRVTDKTAQWKMSGFMTGYEYIQRAQQILLAA